MERSDKVLSRDYKKTDWPSFKRDMGTGIIMNREIKTIEQLENYVELQTPVINRTINADIPILKYTSKLPDDIIAEIYETASEAADKRQKIELHLDNKQNEFNKY